MPSVFVGTVFAAQAQASARPSYAVVEFADVWRGNRFYGKATAGAVADELGKTFDVASQDRVEAALAKGGLSFPPTVLTNLMRLGRTALPESGAPRIVVKGMILEYRIERAARSKRGVVAIGVELLDLDSATRIDGTLVKGESAMQEGVPDDELMHEAIRDAAAIAVETLKAQRPLAATVLISTSGQKLINAGERNGFAQGDELLLVRWGQPIGTARVVRTESEQAMIVSTQVVPDIRGGDRVRRIYVAPKLPTDGESLFERGCRGLGLPKR